MLPLVMHAPEALAYSSDRLKADEEVVLAAIAQDWMALVCAAEPLTADAHFMRRAVSLTQRGACLQYASEELLADHDFALSVLTEFEDAYKFIHDDLKISTNFQARAVAANPKLRSLWMQDGAAEPAIF